MALWDKVKTELDRAGRVAQEALDEGKGRLEAFRARQRADRIAQAIGYAYYNARQSGTDVEPDVYARLASELAAEEVEIARHESEAKAAEERRKAENV